MESLECKIPLSFIVEEPSRTDNNTLCIFPKLRCSLLRFIFDKVSLSSSIFSLTSLDATSAVSIRRISAFVNFPNSLDTCGNFMNKESCGILAILFFLPPPCCFGSGIASHDDAPAHTTPPMMPPTIAPVCGLPKTSPTFEPIFTPPFAPVHAAEQSAQTTAMVSFLVHPGLFGFLPRVMFLFLIRFSLISEISDISFEFVRLFCSISLLLVMIFVSCEHDTNDIKLIDNVAKIINAVLFISFLLILVDS